MNKPVFCWVFWQEVSCFSATQIGGSVKYREIS